MNLLRHLFLPHHSNNQRAKLLHGSSIFFVAVLLFFSSLTVGFLRQNSKSVLGISFNIAAQDLLTFTNQERQAAGLTPLQLNDALSQAAAGKAEDMMTKNYWAHVSPSGTTPWDFITNAGYHYVTAGENLARGYTTSSDVTSAWMASPEHRANVLSKSYQDVGFAIREGSLTGDSDTVLVVEMFGSRTYVPQVQQVPQVVPKVQAQENTTPSPTCAPPPACLDETPKCSVPEPSSGWCLPSPTPTPLVVQHATIQSIKAVNQPLVDSVFLVRLIGTALILMFIVLLAIDLILVGKNRIIRMVGHNIDHIIFLIAILLIATILGSGIIL